MIITLLRFPTEWVAIFRFRCHYVLSLPCFRIIVPKFVLVTCTVIGLVCFLFYLLNCFSYCSVLSPIINVITSVTVIQITQLLL